MQRSRILVMLSVLAMCTLSWVLCPYSTSGQPTPLPYAPPDSCRPGVEHFRSSSLSCEPCGDSQIAADNGFSCTCDSGFVQPIGLSDSNLQCRACVNDTVVSRDGLFCLSCGSGYNPSTKECNSCGDRNQIYMDTLPPSVEGVGNRSCVPCPSGLWADPSGFQCVECGVEDCTTCRESDIRGGVCFLNPSSLPSPPSSAFPYYREHFSAAVQLCRDGNASSCQLVANLCVLQLYNRRDPACVLSQQLSGDLLQDIYYSPQSADEVLERTDIQTTLVTWEGDGGVSVLPLVAASYSLNGSFIGLEDVSDQIMLCRDPLPRGDAVWRVGVQYNIQCTISASKLAKRGSDSPIFYDLYLRDQTPNSTTVRLYPVPILVNNYRDQAGEAINEESDVGNWQFVRRFFMYESVTDNPLYSRDTRLTVLLNSNGRIFPPYLRVAYSPWSPTMDSSLPSSHSTDYVTNDQAFSIALAVLSCVLVVLAMVYAGLKVNGFIRRTGGLCCELHSFVYMLVEFSNGISSALFVLLTASSVFWLIFFKAQYFFLLALPTEVQDIAFQVLLGLALLFRVVHIVYIIWYQCRIDIFFIDWEKPRGLLQPTNHRPAATQTTPPPLVTPVSVWRTLFVVNEWNEIQSQRKINHFVLTMFVLLFAQVVGLEHLAERDTASNVTSDPSRYSASFSPILRFSITALCFSFWGLVMRGYMFLFYERFFNHVLRQFVDLCSVSNVSVFILSRELFGYYIHGKSVHGHADTDMRQLNANLKKEQDDQCGQRGLLADSEQQLFEVAVTRSFRIHFDKILSPLRDRAEGSTRTQKMKGLVGVSDTDLRGYKDMTYYLSTFIEHGLKDVDYITKDKLLAEKVFGIEFFDPDQRSVFYNAPGYSFDDVLFYGCEWSLFQLDVLVFGVVEVVSNSYPLAAVITVLLAVGINFVRDWFGKSNLVRKTLVDERFLI